MVGDTPQHPWTHPSPGRLRRPPSPARFSDIGYTWIDGDVQRSTSRCNHWDVSTIDALQPKPVEIVYWDETLPGFGVKVTPAGRKVFIVLYRTGGSGSRLRKYTLGPHWRVTLHIARGEAPRVLGARREGRDLAGEKRDARRRISSDRVKDLVEAFAKQHLGKRKSGAELARLLQREVVERWGSRSIHTITKREVVNMLGEVVD